MAAASGQDTHTLTVQLPGGAVEQIRYGGNVPPQIDVTPDAVPFGWAVAYFDPAPFVAFDRISAEMDRQMSVMLRNANELAAQSLSRPQGVTEIEAGAGALPARSENYSVVSTVGGNVLCARSVEVTSRGGAGQKPKVASKTYGNCGNLAAGSPGEQSATPADHPSDIRDIKYEPRNIPTGVVREAGAAH
ncbi:MAG: hypothetical protein ACREHV_02605 [Rhizomicrobium sp.]